MLRVRSLESGYGSLTVLKGVSLHVNPGEVVTIVGGNGAGKSTLLNTIAAVVRVRGGSIEFKENDIASQRPDRIVAAGCALVPEGRQLFATMSVQDNLTLGAYRRLRRRQRNAVSADLRRIYRLFPRLAERKEQPAGTLSGGEQQMVAIGRALMTDPDLIMMDEPSMGLAPLIVRDILATVAELKTQGKTILLVEQNARAALSVADRGYVMETGRLVLEGTASDLLDNRDVQRAYLGKEYRQIDEKE
jgi:branched-chain amino acid transport system ATP-binding protein